jgi:putative addiction module killer protein
MFEVLHYTTANGQDLFALWLNDLRDRRASSKVLARIDRLALGNFGDYRVLDGGVYELRIDWGPGYRVYFARVGKSVLILLCGGDKTTQQKDIENAKTYLQDYKKRLEKSRAARRPT